jgi:hypothetical protein
MKYKKFLILNEGFVFFPIPQFVRVDCRKFQKILFADLYFQ